MNFEKFKSSKITISVELYLEEHDIIDPSSISLDANTRYVSIYPSNKILEIHENGEQTIQNKSIKLHGSASSFEAMQRELYIWAVVDNAFEELDIEDFILIASFHAGDNAESYNYVVEAISDYIDQYDMDVVDDLLNNLAPIEKRLEEENSDRPLLKNILGTIEDKLNSTYAY